MTASIPDGEMRRIVEALYAGQPLEAIDTFRAAARSEGLSLEEVLDQLETRLRTESPGGFAPTSQSARGRLLFILLVLAILLGGGVATVSYLGSPAPLPTKSVQSVRPSQGPLNASDPATPVDPAQEQGRPFSADLAGRWRLRLPAGFEHPAELERVDQDHYRLKTRGVMNGVYQLLGQRLVMETPVDARQRTMWKFRWQIDNENHLLLIGQPAVGSYGAMYLGATLKRAAP